MTSKELRELGEKVWDININPHPTTLTMALLDLRSALHKVIRHLEHEQRDKDMSPA